MRHNFEDVYSTVSFSRRIFDSAGRGYANYDILGGWMCGSPLYYDKLRRYGITSVQEALIERGNVYLILANQEVKERFHHALCNIHRLHTSSR